MRLRWQIAQAAEIRWWQNYLKNKSKSEYIDWKYNYWKTFLKKINLEVSLDASILDAGCGPAGIFMILDNHNVDAIDPLLSKYETKIPYFKTSDYPNVQFINTSIEKFEPEKLYDLIFCINAINHVSDIQMSIRKLVDVLKPNGMLVLSIDAHNYSFLKNVFKLIPGDILHPHQYDLSEYENLLIQNNLKIQKSTCYQEHFIFNYFVIVSAK